MAEGSWQDASFHPNTCINSTVSCWVRSATIVFWQCCRGIHCVLKNGVQSEARLYTPVDCQVIHAGADRVCLLSEKQQYPSLALLSGGYNLERCCPIRQSILEFSGGRLCFMFLAPPPGVAAGSSLQDAPFHPKTYINGTSSAYPLEISLAVDACCNMVSNLRIQNTNLWREINPFGA